MSTSSPPPGGDKNRGIELIPLVWSQALCSLILVSLRMYTRARLIRSVGWDDWWIVYTLVCIIISSAFWTVYAAEGYARHSYYLSQSQQALAAKWDYESQCFCICAIGGGKISVALLIKRIHGVCQWRDWVLNFVIDSIMLTTSFAIILLYVQCKPLAALWNPSLVEDGVGSCWNPAIVNDFDLFCGSYWAFTDVFLALLPLTFLYNLQVSIKRRILLAGLLGLGILAGICGAIKTSYWPTDTTRTDFTWVTVDLMIWNSLEINVMTFAACFPTLQPFFRLVYTKAHHGVSKIRSSNQVSQESAGKTVELQDSSSGDDRTYVGDRPPRSRVNSWMGYDRDVNTLPANIIRRTMSMEISPERLHAATTLDLV